MPDTNLDRLRDVFDDDLRALINAEKNYGDSWKRRGGVGAFMMLARKWDRLERHLANSGEKYDIIACAEADPRPEGVIDDIRDLRRYLALVEAELRSRGRCPALLAKDSG